MCMQPPAINIDYKDELALLPREAWLRIEAFLASDADAPGREEVLEVYCRLLFEACRQGEAKLLTVNNRLRMNEKLRGMWRDRMQKMRIT